MKYIYIVIIALILAVIALVILLIIDKKKSTNSSILYLQSLNELYDSGKPVVLCLNEIQKEFKKGSIECIAVEHANFYLNCSIKRDYETAFSIIEKVFKDQTVKEKHATIIEKEQENIIYLLQ